MHPSLGVHRERRSRIHTYRTPDSLVNLHVLFEAGYRPRVMLTREEDILIMRYSVRPLASLKIDMMSGLPGRVLSV